MTGIWVNPCSTIKCSASATRAEAGKVLGSRVITSATAVLDGSPSAIARLVKSRVVMIPCSAPVSEVTSKQETRLSRIFCAALSKLSCSVQVRGLHVIKSPKVWVDKALRLARAGRVRSKKSRKAGCSFTNLWKSGAEIFNSSVGFTAVAVTGAIPSRIKPRSPNEFFGPRIETSSPLGSVISTCPETMR